MANTAAVDEAPVSRPPILPTVLAILTVSASVLAQIRYPASAHVGVHLAGWLAGGVGTVACLAFHRLADQRLQHRFNYQRPAGSGRLILLTAGLGLIVAATHAYHLAWWYHEDLTSWLTAVRAWFRS